MTAFNKQGGILSSLEETAEPELMPWAEKLLGMIGPKTSLGLNIAGTAAGAGAGVYEANKANQHLGPGEEPKSVLGYGSLGALGGFSLSDPKTMIGIASRLGQGYLEKDIPNATIQAAKTLLTRKAVPMGSALVAYKAVPFLENIFSAAADTAASANTQKNLLTTIGLGIGSNPGSTQARETATNLKAFLTGLGGVGGLKELPQLMTTVKRRLEEPAIPDWLRNTGLGIGAAALGIGGFKAYQDYKYRRAAEESMKRKVRVTLPTAQGGHETQVETSMEELPQSIQQSIQRDLKRKLRTEGEERKMHKESAILEDHGPEPEVTGKRHKGISEGNLDAKPNDEFVTAGETTEVKSKSVKAHKIADEVGEGLGKVLTRVYGKNDSQTIKQAFKEGFAIGLAEQQLIPSDLEKAAASGGVSGAVSEGITPVVNAAATGTVGKAVGLPFWPSAVAGAAGVNAQNAPELAGEGLTALGKILGAGVLLPGIAGFGLGSAFGGMNKVDPTDINTLKQRDLMVEYERAANELRSRMNKRPKKVSRVQINASDTGDGANG